MICVGRGRQRRRGRRKGKAGAASTGITTTAAAATSANPKPSGARDTAIPDLLRLAAEESGRGHQDVAVRYYQDVLDLDIDNEAAMACLGAEFVDMKRYDEAYACFKSVLDRNPHSATALIGIGDLCMALVEFEQAAAAYGRAAKADPALAEPHAGRGTALMNLGQFDKAKKAFAAALCRDTESVAALNMLGTCLLDTDAPLEALHCFGRVHELCPDMRGATRYNIGKCLQELKRHGEAIDSFEKALAVDDEDMDSAIEIGCSLAAMGRTDAAIKQLDEVIEDAEGTDAAVSAMEHKARILDGIGKAEDAAEVCDEIMALDPDNTGALLRKGRILARSNRRLAALSCISVARYCDPDHGEAKRDAAVVSLALKRDGKLPWMWDKRRGNGRKGGGGGSKRGAGGMDEWMQRVRARQNRRHAKEERARECGKDGGGCSNGSSGGGGNSSSRVSGKEGGRNGAKTGGPAASAGE